ncbi:MAG: 3-isopropylmalate dehydratase large subunit [Clostridiales Family XIII bacterium]|jgi:3-isopropylmalate/(R)-2-methylmalate dehydratase large subunit|nr:3-isopropylmalate dehydratase large subunit [Clostridiales Family XIII bacterium]
MGKTMSEKILARAAGVGEASAGDILWVNVDMAMMDDILGPRVEIAEGLMELGDRVWDADKVAIISDHYTPPASVKQAEIVKFTREWAALHGIKNYYEFVGPCHQIMAEKGFVLPGTVVLGTDSHTCMGGALGAFATGVGSTEMLGVLVTGQTWLRVPETIRVVWGGSLNAGVMAKDISLETIREIGHAGATYKAVEYVGEAISSLPVDERMAITNMAVEMGAKAGMMEYDGEAAEFLAGRTARTQDELAAGALSSDADASFARTLVKDASALTPMIACPHSVDNVHRIEDVEATKIDQAYLGSCTGGRYSDLKAAAELVKGRRIAGGIRFLVSPASQEIWERASRDGILQTLAEAGGTILAPTCGVCVGLHSGLLGAGEACISSSNRNFIGRMGSKEAEIYLASPLSVAAAALAGRITDPREVAA